MTTALRLGADGIWCRVWSTKDGVAVLHPTGRVGGALRRRTLTDLAAVDLPSTVVTLDSLVSHAHQTTLILDPTGTAVGEASTGESLLHEARAAGFIDRLWLVSHDVDQLIAWRHQSAAVRLAHVSRLNSLDGGSERHANRLRTANIDALCLPAADWNAGQVTMLHRFRREAWATGAQHERVIHHVLDMGVDAVCGGFVDRMVDAATIIG